MMGTTDRTLPKLVPDTPPPTVVAGGIPVAHLPYTRKEFLGSPSIVVRSDGAYVVTHDVFGSDSTSSDTYVYLSDDAGESWRQIAHVPNAFWSTIFARGETLYLLGTSTEYGDLLIRRSDDGGHTWTTPLDERTGILRTDARFHTAAVPVVEHNGRLWRSYEVTTALGMQWGHFAAGIMSAPVDSDLLMADNWALTPPLELPDALRAKGCAAWLEGNVVPGTDGALVNVLRAEVWDQGHQVAARVSVDTDGRHVRANTEDALMSMPGGGSKFSIKKDLVSGAYYALVNTALYDSSPHLRLRARNTLSIARTHDLDTWEVLEVIAHHPDDQLHGFQYADWTTDGDDLIAVVRTADDFEGAAAHSYHDSNLITFHRIKNFRDRWSTSRENSK
jgi:hypothetical protein